MISALCHESNTGFFHYSYAYHQISLIAVSTQCENNYSIDGSRSCDEVTTGNNLEFVEAGVKAMTSLKVVMYNIVIKQNVTRA